MRKTTNDQPLSAQKGFTLVELMIVVVIAAILASVAVPSFRSFIQGQAVKSAATDLHASFALARSEAVKRAARILVTSTSGGWIMGWQVTTDAATPVVIEDRAAPKDIAITVTGSTTPNTISYLPDGRVGPTEANTKFTFSATGTSTTRCLNFSLRGPAEVSPC